MHLIIPFAAPASDAGRKALAALKPGPLQRLLARWLPAERWSGDDLTLSAPHERVRALATGLVAEDGCWPWASLQAAQDGVDIAGSAWALLTPAHLHLGTDQVTLTDPDDLALEAGTSRELLEAVRSLFESEGFTLAWGAPLRWYAAHALFDGLPTASLDRVVGRNINRWLPDAPQARLLRRLQNEVQMLLYTHPINDRREAAGQRPVNSFWVSGCGRAQSAARVAPPRVDERLRGPALNEDWPSWSAAWPSVGADAMRALQDDPQGRITLCGERGAASWTAAGAGAWRRWTSAWRPTDLALLLEGL